MANCSITSTITVNCPKCGSPKVVRAGKQGSHQRYLCRDCGSKFRADGITKGHRYADETVAQAIGSFFSGMSYKSISKLIRDPYDTSKPSKSTLYDWVYRYSTGANDILRKYPATTGGHWAADEIEYKIKDQDRKFWMWVVIDKKTRYLLAIHLAWSKDAEQTKQVLRKALAVAASPPAKITTDRALSYYPAIRSVMPETRHIESRGIRSYVNNNLCEGVNGSIRQRTKVLRGINDIATAQIMRDGWRLHYNFFRDHEGINNQTPARAAKIESPFKEWTDVVRANAKAPKRKPKPRMHRIAAINGPVVKKRERINLSKPKVLVSDGTAAMFNRKTLAPNRKLIRQLQHVTATTRAGRQKPQAPQPVMPGLKPSRKVYRGPLEPSFFDPPKPPGSKGPRPQPAGSGRR